MSMDRNFVVKVWTVDPNLAEYVIVRAESYGLAGRKVEEFYNDSTIDYEIAEMAEGCVSFITKDCYKAIMSGDLN